MSMTKDIKRREFLTQLGLGGLAVSASTLSPLANAGSRKTGRVLVIGGGFGGATAAKYLKRLDPGLDVTLIEPAKRFYTCPFSNLYLAGLRDFEQIGHDYERLKADYGVKVIHQLAKDVDTEKRRIVLADGTKLKYDRLLVSPGIDFRWGALAGYDEAAAQYAPHAWKAGPQTKLLKQQLDAMDDGGVFTLVAPANPFRCPPGPYERVSMVAHYLKTHKPKSKILLLDAKDRFSKQGLFMEGWKAVYGDMIEWVSLSNDGRVTRVDARKREVETEFGQRHKSQVLNIVPPQKAGVIAGRAGITDESGWVPVKPHSFESTQVPGVYAVGDATIAGPMPKSGFCANAQAKVAAMAIVADLAGQKMPEPYWLNTCYSLIAPGYGISVANVYKLIDGKITQISGGVSPGNAEASFRRKEARNGAAWYHAITQDIWGTAPRHLV